MKNTLGEILVRLGWVSEQEVDAALRQDGLLGERLVDAGVIAEDHVGRALEIQNKLRDGAHPVLGELAVLHEVTKTAHETARQVSDAIAKKRRRRRERGERTDVFLVSLPQRAKG